VPLHCCAALQHRATAADHPAIGPEPRIAWHRPPVRATGPTQPLRQERNAPTSVFADCRPSAWVAAARKDPRNASVERARLPLPSARRGQAAAASVARSGFALPQSDPLGRSSCTVPCGRMWPPGSGLRKQRPRAQLDCRPRSRSLAFFRLRESRSVGVSCFNCFAATRACDIRSESNRQHLKHETPRKSYRARAGAELAGTTREQNPLRADGPVASSPSSSRSR
jgi:hypothetical protein